MENKISNYKFFVFSVLIVLGIIFQKNYYVLLIVLSFGTIFGGIISLCSKDSKGIVFLDFGVSLLCSDLLVYFKIIEKSKIILLFCTMFMVLFIFFGMIMFIITYYYEKNYFNKKVAAKVYDVKKVANTKKYYFEIIYQYEYKKQKYFISHPKYKKNFFPKIGSTIELYINEDNPEDVYFKKSMFLMLSLVFGILVFLGVCIYIVFTIIK